VQQTHSFGGASVGCVPVT